MRNVCRVVLVVVLFGTVQLFAQAPTTIPVHCRVLLGDVHEAKVKGTAGKDELALAVSAALRLKENAVCFSDLLAADQIDGQQSFLAFARALESRRTDKQAGSASGTAGSTSLVSKGIAAQALSVATEYGALTESVNKQVITIQGSLEAPAAALVSKKLIAYCPEGSTEQTCLSRDGLRMLRRFTYGVSFDTSLNQQNIVATASGAAQGTAQPVTFTANKNQITAITGRAILWSTRDADSDTFKKTWANALQPDAKSKSTPDPNLALLQGAGKDLLKSLQSLARPVDMGDPEISKWFTAAFEMLSTADDDDIDRIWLARSTEFVAIAKRLYPTIGVQAADFVQKSSVYRLAEDRFVEGMANKPVLTFEFNNNRPAAATPRSNFRVIFDKGFGKVSVTANGAFTIFDSQQAGAAPGSSRLRDAQFGIQVQRDLGNLSSIGAAAVAATYYFQHQSSADILTVTPGTPLPGITLVGLPSNATQVFGQKGDIHVVQARLVLGAGQSSVRFPLAVSWSNRTELIAKPTWRAQLGVSYDLDSLFAK